MTINCNSRLLDLSSPKVMGILNLTPDSFFDGNDNKTLNRIKTNIHRILDEDADIIDLGAMSSKPGAIAISEQEEINRLKPALNYLNQLNNSKLIISIDTYRANVIRWAVDNGAHLINDISAGCFDNQLFATVAELQIPYVLMHMKGTPSNMQENPQYVDVTMEVLRFFIHKIELLKSSGVKDIILDLGFGFGKTLEHNYELLRKMEVFKILELPILTGVSRKSMIYKLLNNNPKEALNGTTALHMISLINGSNILRVHDVKEAKECIKLYQKLKQ